VASDMSRLNLGFLRLYALAEDLLASQLDAGAENISLSRAPERWIDLVSADHSLGEGEVVEAWVLAEHFLKEWVDWITLLRNYGQYYGVESRDITFRWEPLHMLCREVARLLLADRDLVGVIFRNGGNSDRFVAGHVDSTDPVSLYHALVDVDRAERIHSERLAADEGTQTRIVADRQLLGELVDVLKQDAPIPFRIALPFLHNYWRSTLQLSWLVPPTRAQVLSSVIPAQIEELATTLIEGLPNQSEADDPALWREAIAVIRRVVTAIYELGYDAWLDDMTAREMRHGPEGPAGSSWVNVIPGSGSDTCAPILLAVSRGSRGTDPASLTRVMKAMKQHLARCRGVTKLVLVTMDTWNAQRFETGHRRALAKFHQEGVTFIFLLVGSPRRRLSPLTVDLNAPGA